jgi:hypothetical protein
MAVDCSELIRKIESDPVYRWGQKRFNRNGQDPKRVPKEAWSLQQTIALQLAQGRLVVHDVSNSTIARNELAHHVLDASTVLWSREIFEAATDADFQGAVRGKPEGEPSPSFWVLDSLVVTSALSLLAFALIPDRPDRTLVAPIGGPHAGFVPFAVHYGSTREQHREYWTTVAEQTEAPFLIGLADLCFRAAVLGSAFLESPYIPKDRVTVGKPSRKDSPAVRRKAKPRDVTVVNLRRAMAENGDSGLGDDSTESERRSYSHRWLVSGHFRNQAYGPSHSLRKVIWIPPYLKDPEDAPLNKTVYRAIR